MDVPLPASRSREDLQQQQDQQTPALPVAASSLQNTISQLQEELRRENDRSNLLEMEVQRLSLGQLLTTDTTDTTNNKNSNSNSIKDPVSSSLVSISSSTLGLLELKVSAMEAVKEGIAIADATKPDMPLIYVNSGFCSMTGYSKEEVLGKNCRFLQGPGTEDHTVEVLKRSISEEKPCVVEIMNYRRSGDPFINYLSLTPIFDPTGRTLTHMVGVQSDITELVAHRRGELAAKHAALAAAAATEAKSTFLARMSHEIRTPLNGMIAVGQLLSETELSPAQFDLVNTIRCSGEALLTLISDILDFSKIEANKMELNSAPFKLQSVIEASVEIAGLQASHKRLQVAYHIYPGVPRTLVGDAQRLQQVLLNTLINAVKFTEAGQVVLEVWAEEEEEEEEEYGGGIGKEKEGKSKGKGKEEENASPPLLKPNAITVHFSVRDTGIGISPNDLHRLFQSFSQLDVSPTRQYGGSGLGLIISQKLCEAMGGTMWVHSDGHNKGSTFRWSIKSPRQNTTTTTTSGGGGEKNGSSIIMGNVISTVGRGGSRDAYDGKVVGGVPRNILEELDELDGPCPQLKDKKIILVEPCDVVRQVLQCALKKWGCLVTVVQSESEALKRLLNNKKHNNNNNDDASGGGDTATNSATSLTLQFGPPLSTASTDLEQEQQGPYDVLIMDLTYKRLISALVGRCDHGEARRIVFMGWPGENDPEEEDDDDDDDIMAYEAMLLSDDDGDNDDVCIPQPPPTTTMLDMMTTTRTVSSIKKDNSTSNDNSSSSTTTTKAAVINPVVQLPRSLLVPLPASTLKMKRHIGYVVVTRPVRQGRLRLALEEVLSMELNLSVDEEDEQEKMMGGVVDGVAVGGGVQGEHDVRQPTSTSSQNNNLPKNTDTDVTTTTTTTMSMSRKSLSGLQGGGSGGAGSAASFSFSHQHHHPSSSSFHSSKASSCVTTNSHLHGAPNKRAASSASSLSQSHFYDTHNNNGAAASHHGDDNHHPNNGSNGAAASAVTNSNSIGKVLHFADRKLLLAEDHPLNMKVALSILKKLGFTDVTTAVNGKEAVDAVTAAGGLNAFYALLVDLHMPVMTGLEAVQEIRKKWPGESETRIIAVTADAFEDTRDLCMANGFSGWLAKPFRVEEFSKLICSD